MGCVNGCVDVGWSEFVVHQDIQIELGASLPRINRSVVLEFSFLSLCVYGTWAEER